MWRGRACLVLRSKCGPVRYLTKRARCAILLVWVQDAQHPV